MHTLRAARTLGLEVGLILGPLVATVHAWLSW